MVSGNAIDFINKYFEQIKNSEIIAKQQMLKFSEWKIIQIQKHKTRNLNSLCELRGKKIYIYIIDNLNTNLISSKFNQMKCLLKEKVGFQP